LYAFNFIISFVLSIVCVKNFLAKIVGLVLSFKRAVQMSASIEMAAS